VPRAKYCADLLKTVAVHKEQRTDRHKALEPVGLETTHFLQSGGPVTPTFYCVANNVTISY